MAIDNDGDLHQGNGGCASGAMVRRKSGHERREMKERNGGLNGRGLGTDPEVSISRKRDNQ